jgi:RNA polymerase sigma factor (sigma-70 family)
MRQGGCAAGREAIIGRLGEHSDRWYQDLVSAIGSRVGSVPVEEDDVQEAVIRYWEHISMGEEIRCGPAWVQAVARNMARSQSRRRATEARALQRLQRERPPPLGGSEVDSLAEELRHRVSRLAPRQRHMVVLYYYGDLSVAEVATAAGCSVGTVKATLHQARRILSAALQPDHRTTELEVTPMSLAHWGITGTHRHEYEIDRTDDWYEGKPVAVLRCIAKRPGGFGALVQRFEPGAFTGHRVRFSGKLRAEGVSGWAGLWMRVDGAASSSHKNPLAFYNNEDRGLMGTTGWYDQDAVLDVGEDAAVILIGAILSGKGALYVANFAVDIVGPEVELTRQPSHHDALLPRPTNLSFDVET